MLFLFLVGQLGAVGPEQQILRVALQRGSSPAMPRGNGKQCSNKLAPECSKSHDRGGKSGGNGHRLDSSGIPWQCRNLLRLHIDVSAARRGNKVVARIQFSELQVAPRPVESRTQL